MYDHSANLICPQDPCSVVKCGFHASCTVVGDQGICACDVGYSQGNPYQVNFQPKVTVVDSALGVWMYTLDCYDC